MFTLNGKQFRSLEEQVAYLSELYEAGKAFDSWGIKIVGKLENASELPIPYTGEFGDAFAVGIEAPFNFYIWTRASITGGDDYWFPFGETSLVGPQGPQGIQGSEGPQGIRGSKWFSGDSIPTTGIPGINVDDQYLYTQTGDVYKYADFLGMKFWQKTGNIRGPQGIQGVQGPKGDQGVQGPKGDKGATGDVGGFIQISGQLTSTSQLPNPALINNLTVAYLVNNDLYIQIGQDSNTALWTNMGPLNVATLVTVGGQYQNIWNADVKVNVSDLPNILSEYAPKNYFNYINVDDIISSIKIKLGNTADTLLNEEMQMYIIYKMAVQAGLKDQFGSTFDEAKENYPNVNEIANRFASLTGTTSLNVILQALAIASNKNLSIVNKKYENDIKEDFSTVLSGMDNTINAPLTLTQGLHNKVLAEGLGSITFGSNLVTDASLSFNQGEAKKYSVSTFSNQSDKENARQILANLATYNVINDVSAQQFLNGEQDNYIYTYGQVKGESSVALNGSSAIGGRAFAAGMSTASGSNSISMGNQNLAAGDSSICLGGYGNLSVSYGAATIGGEKNKVSHGNSIVCGYRNKSSKPNQFVTGVFNKDNADALLIIGNGTSDTNRRNVFEVLSDGRAKVMHAPQDGDDVIRLEDIEKLIPIVNELSVTQINHFINWVKQTFSEEE